MAHHTRLAALGAEFRSPLDIFWSQVYENELIVTYVPKADQLNREKALALAIERDNAAAAQLQLDATQLDLEAAAFAAAAP